MVYVLLRNTWRKRGAAHSARPLSPGQMSAAARRAELAENLAAGHQYADDQEMSEELRLELQRELEELERKQGKCRLEIVAFGTISSGKSALLNALVGRDVFASDVVGGTTVARSEVPWPGSDEVVLVDTPRAGRGPRRGPRRRVRASPHARPTWCCSWSTGR